MCDFSFDLDHIQLIIALKVVRRYPKMERFHNSWPVTDIMQATLKRSSRKARAEKAVPEATDKAALEVAEKAAQQARDVGPIRNARPSTKVCDHFLCSNLPDVV